MSQIDHARVAESLASLRLTRISEQLDTLLSEAARGQPTYLNILDRVLREEVEAKQRKRAAMHRRLHTSRW